MLKEKISYYRSLKKPHQHAFSLVELAVVILILGVLIAGLVQSSRLITNMRLNVARDVTQSSAMPWINYIVTWYDSTAIDAFNESDTDDGDLISRWNGAEIRYSDRINLVQTDSTKKPTYVSNGMFGLPSVKFDGTSDILESESSNQDVLTYRSGTIFVVFEPKTVNSANKKTIFFNTSSCDTELDFGMSFNNVKGAIGIASAVSGEGCSTTYATQSSGDFAVPNEKIVASLIIYQSPTTQGSTDNIKIFRNGNLWSSNQVNAQSFNSPTISSSQKYSSGNNKFYVGAKKTGATEKAFFDGLIGEMIIFNRSLNNEDRNEVERYLGKKWGIKIKFLE
ncbi:MAG: prepilin-type N-terminal cleavage/methylation domain-containing protein [Proteobacteria bacterium]|nr:prepilin-type N-terminal cleavage/methylation domain-containing protein [Pseudomonadota bacterium]NCA27937.1 prepilin-type N-terminal cleavage/methylation domain-containing protein [Pseudomonadota bacterium]